MALTSKLEVDLVVSLDDEQKNILWSLTDVALNQVVRSDLTVHSAGVAKLLAAGSLALPMGDVGTGAILMLRADKEVSVFLNGGAEAITVKPLGAYKGMLVLHGAFTAVSVTAAAAAAQVEYCFVGAE